MRYKLFVYGTLKRGFCNHHYLKNATFLGKATTKANYVMIAPKVWYPYLIEAQGKGKQIVGELYMIDLPTLKRIDRLEEYPVYYDRKKIIVLDEAGKEHEALAYFLKKKIPYWRFVYLKEFHPPQE